MALYERLRTDLLRGQANREEVTAFRFHGMWQALAILLTIPLEVSPECPPVPASQPLRHDSEFVRLLANLVLQTHSELAHVC